jgi:hypothetical protein
MGMHKSQESSSNPDPIIVAIWLGILAIIAPTSIILIPNETILVRYPLWSFTADQFKWIFIFGISTSSYFVFFQSTILFLIFLGLRLAFALQAMRYYQRLTTIRRTLLVGVMSSFIELTSLAPFLIAPGVRIIPLPILLILGSFLLFMTEEPLIRAPPLRREPVIIFSLIPFILSSSFNPFGVSFPLALFIVALVIIESRRK